MSKMGSSGHCPVCGFDLVCAECAEMKQQLADERAVIEQAIALMCEDRCSHNCCSYKARALLVSATEGGEG